MTAKVSPKLLNRHPQPQLGALCEQPEVTHSGEHLPHQVCQSDITEKFFKSIYACGLVAWDIETSGLDWRVDRLATCQLYVPGSGAVLVRIGQRPSRLLQILADPAVKKLFHHAMFDLRFLISCWSVKPQNIICTKVAAKLLDKDNLQSHSLQSLLCRRLDICLDKSEQKSDWSAPSLTAQQVQYAASDVIYLPSLLTSLETDLRCAGLFDFAQECFRHIPTRAQLEISGYGDIYTY